MVDAGLRGVRAGLQHHLHRHVHADDAARRTHGARGEEAVKPRAAAEVEDRLAGAQRGDGVRVAAAQPEVGTDGSGGDFLSAVTQCLRADGGRATTTATGGGGVRPAVGRTCGDGGVGFADFGAHGVRVFRDGGVGVHGRCWRTGVKGTRGECASGELRILANLLPQKSRFHGEFTFIPARRTHR